MSLEADVVYWSAIGALNLALAMLLLGVRPVRVPNVLAAVLIGLNGAFGFLLVLEMTALAGGPPPPYHLYLSAFHWVLNLPTLAALAIFPLFFPRRLLPRAAERWVLWGAAAYIALNSTLSFLWPQQAGNNLIFPISAWTGFLPFFLALLGGTLVLVHTYLTTPSQIIRNQARIVLAAYALKTMGYLHEVLRTLDNVTPSTRPTFYVYAIPLALGLGTIVIALFVSRFRPGVGGPARGWGEDAFVLGLPLLFLAATPTERLPELEWTVIRPVLFAYAVLRYQLLDVDIRNHRPFVAVALLASVGSVFIVSAYHLDILRVPPAIAAGVALTATLGVLGILLWPIVRALLAPGPDDEDRRSRELYRAALEQAVVGGDGHTVTNQRILAALRSRLQIGDREHSAMEASARALFGKAVDLQSGQRFLGRYRVERLLGEGGFGRTHLVFDEQMGRPAVLKTARVASAEDRRKLLREARTIAKLNHPAIVTVYDVDEVGGEAFLILEYVAAGSLDERLRRGPIGEREATAIVRELLEALEAAHARGIIHRDLKPSNVLLTSDGHAKLADFGIARSTGPEATLSHLSVAGEHPGSLHYMSPEQVRGLELDARSDLYSLGVLWYEMLTGRPYLRFNGRSAFDARIAILEEKPKLPLPRVSATTNALLRSLLAKDASSRPPSARDAQRSMDAATLPMADA